MTQPNTIPFWYENPNILFDKNYILEFFPTNNMTYNQKLNAISRSVIFLSLVSFLFTPKISLIIVCVLLLAAIYLVYASTEKDKKKKPTSIESTEDSPNLKEGFDESTTGFSNPVYKNYKDPGIDLMVQNNIPIPVDTFQEPSPTNPLSNVLISDYDYNPNKKPAPPSYNNQVNQSILQSAKTLVQEANPGQPNISDKLFKDLSEQLNFEQSMRPFHSTANTQIPNDQGSFADFCYGSMISAKEGNMFAAARNLSRHTLY